jgi:rod shape-determining protein MreD
LIAHLVCFLSLVVFYILQTSIFSQTMLISGSADLVMLFLIAWSLQEQVKNSWLWAVVAGFIISIVSAMPFFAPLLGYLGVLGISKLLQRRLWRIPILVMFIITFMGTFYQQALYVVTLQVSGVPIPWDQSLDAVILPSVLLNLIFAIPIYAIANELVGRIYPLEVEA